MAGRRVFSWAVVVVGIVLLLAACNRLELEKSITMESVFPTATATDVTIYYTVPPPPAGKIYVLWILNPVLRQAVSAGQVPGGANLTARAHVDFAATGAVVSIEDQPNPATMSSTWALRVGAVTLQTPTPGAGPTAVSTPNASGTSLPVATPNAAGPTTMPATATP